MLINWTQLDHDVYSYINCRVMNPSAGQLPTMFAEIEAILKVRRQTQDTILSAMEIFDNALGKLIREKP